MKIITLFFFTILSVSIAFTQVSISSINKNTIEVTIFNNRESPLILINPCSYYPLVFENTLKSDNCSVTDSVLIEPRAFDPKEIGIQNILPITIYPNDSHTFIMNFSLLKKDAKRLVRNHLVKIKFFQIDGFEIKDVYATYNN